MKPSTLRCLKLQKRLSGCGWSLDKQVCYFQVGNTYTVVNLPEINSKSTRGYVRCFFGGVTVSLHKYIYIYICVCVMYFYMYVFCRGDVNVLGVIPHHPYPLRSGTKQTFEPTFSAGRETSTRGS